MATHPHTESRLCKALLFFSLLALQSIGQISDTINKFDDRHQKTGYWIFYLDSSFRNCEIGPARYYGYLHYNRGIPGLQPTASRKKKDIVSYAPLTETHEVPTLLNGEITVYYDKTKKEWNQEIFRNGVLKEVKEYLKWNDKSISDRYSIYADSLYHQDPNTYLCYKQVKNVTLYKQYLSYKAGKPVSEKLYFVDHRDFKKIDRPLMGYHVFWDDTDSLTRHFAELGFSRKYISGTRMDTVGLTENEHGLRYHSLNFSLMASNSNKQFYLGQKLTWSYTLLLLRAEAGFVNYTNFRTTDLAAVFGIGFTVFGYFHEMFYFSIPIASQKRSDYPRVSASIVFN